MYSIGDRFKVKGIPGEYILSQIKPGICTLISLRGGNRLSDTGTIEVENHMKITESELKHIAQHSIIRLVGKRFTEGSITEVSKKPKKPKKVGKFADYWKVEGY